MSGWLLIFEDQAWRSLRPLTDLTPVPALAFGASTLAARWRLAADRPLLGIQARPAAMAAWGDAPAPEAPERARPDDEVLAVNAAALPGPWLAAAFAAAAPAAFMGEGRLAAARFPLSMLPPPDGDQPLEARLAPLGLTSVPSEVMFLTYPWDVIEANADAIEDDLAEARPEHHGHVHRLAALEDPERIRIEPGAAIDAFAVLDARGGPVLIGAGARITAHSVISGPCVIGSGTEVLGGHVARSTLGPQCRVAGEIEECVWQGHANKRHHGFVGHSAIGEWANLGALTTTSDLKNNYGTVRMWVDGAEKESGRPKLGAMIGAHVKTGIGTLLPTGASVGVGANLFGGGRFAPRRVPSFGWWDGERILEHELERFLATARTVMSRRGRALLPADEALLRATFALTSAERGLTGRS